MQDYPEALTPRTQPEVQRAVRRFRALPLARRENTPLLYWLLGQGTPAFKMTKADTAYTDESVVPGETCANCEFAYRKVHNGRYICSQIAGPILPPGWCNRWRPGT